MRNMLPFLGLLLQLLFAAIAFIWVVAFLGFADETRRSTAATLFGKLIAAFCVLVAVIPVGITLWVSWRRFFSKASFQLVPLGVFLPLVATLCSLLLCAGLIYLFKSAGYSQKGKP